MSRLRLLIKRPERANTCIPVTVDSTDIIGNCISSLVDHLAYPRRDSLGRELIYALRPLGGTQSLPSAMRFSDVQLLPETRLMLEVDDVNAVTQPMRTSRAENAAAYTPTAGSLVHSPRQLVGRRNFVVGGVLAGCALGGLFTGIATAFATKQRALPMARVPSPLPSPQAPGVLQQSVLFSGHQQTVRAVSWSPDGATVASGADDGVLLLWTTDGQVQQQIPHPEGVTALAWSPGGQRLASGSGKSVRFFDRHSAVLLAPVHSVHTAQVTSLAWSKAVGQLLISGSLDKRAVVWDTQEYLPHTVFTRHTAAILALSCQPGSAIVASASQGGVVRVWHADTLQELHGFYQDAQLPMHAVAFAPTGNQIAVGGTDGVIRLWSNGLVCQRSVTAQGDLSCLDAPLRLHGHATPIRAVAWSADGRFLATGGDDGVLAIWTLTQRPSLLTTVMHRDPVLAISWSPNTYHIAVASGKTVTIGTLQV